jgi:hypothetical protein
MMDHIRALQTGRVLRYLAGAVFLVVFAACDASANEPLATGIAQTTENMNLESPTVPVVADQNWIILDEENAEDMVTASGLVKTDSFWTPSVEAVLKLEENVAAYLSQNSYAFFYQPPVWERLDEYQRQYIGLERGGEKIIYGNFFCDNGGPDWRQEFVFVIDGGECYFQVEYDVKSGLFIKLRVNGEA